MYEQSYYKCPIEGCGKNVRNLPRHLKSQKFKDHSWTDENARAVVGYCDLRKKQEKKKEKDYHHKKICPVEKCKMVVKRLPQHLQTTHKMKLDENYYAVLKQAEKYFEWNIMGSSPKKTISVPVSCSREPKTPAKSAISLNPSKTPEEPKTPSNSAIVIKSYKTPDQPNKATFMPFKQYKDIPTCSLRSPLTTPSHTLVAPKRKQQIFQFSQNNKNNVSNTPDVKNNLSESFNSELSPEPCSPKSRTVILITCLVLLRLANKEIHSFFAQMKLMKL